MHLLLATRNRHKTREFAQILGSDFAVSDLSSLEETLPPIAETGQTFAENAILKAIGVSRYLAGSAQGTIQTAQRDAALVVADDSGLEVDSLGGEPGVRSARYAGERATDDANVVKLLRALSPTTSGTARFRCVIALARDGSLLRTFEGTTRGAITNSPRGEGGFGYDPVFQPEGFDQTFAELPAEVKNRISHRASAVRALIDYLETIGPRTS